MCLSRVCENHFNNPINHIPFIGKVYRPKLVQFLRRYLAYRNFDRLLLGYKVLTKMPHSSLEFGFPLRDHYIPRYKVGKWYKADERRIIATDDSVYWSGFHIFLSKEAANEWMLCDASNIAIALVEFRDITSVGYQDYNACVVARYMSVIGFLT